MMSNSAASIKNVKPLWINTIFIVSLKEYKGTVIFSFIIASYVAKSNFSISLNGLSSILTRIWAKMLSVVNFLNKVFFDRLNL